MNSQECLVLRSALFGEGKTLALENITRVMFVDGATCYSFTRDSDFSFDASKLSSVKCVAEGSLLVLPTPTTSRVFHRTGVRIGNHLRRPSP
jgi:hypothetical protein